MILVCCLMIIKVGIYVNKWEDTISLKDYKYCCRIRLMELTEASRNENYKMYRSRWYSD